jgi:tetratricopeptide (TPR) repeat protein
MGCFRYQEEVAKVPREGLECLLWDVCKDDHKRIIEGLKNRCLIEYNEKEEYWLQSIIHQEASTRLKNSQDWNMAHNQAADFWTAVIREINTHTEALTVFEAYYHYLAIGDNEKIGEFLCKERNNTWEKDELLGYSLYRLGLFKKIDVIDENILDKIENNYHKVIICTMLARDELFKGNTKTFREYHDKTQEIIKKSLWSDDRQILRIKILKVVSNLYLGFSYIQLWELDQAKIIFNQTLSIIDENLINMSEANFNNAVIEEQSLPIRASYLLKIATVIYIAFTNSSLNNKDTTLSMLEKIDINPTLDYQFNTWGKSLSLLFLSLTYKNIGDIDKAKEYIKKLSEILEQSDYIQLRAKALTSFAELLRIQGKCEEAINNYHLPSIKVLEEIDAKCDLAEAYYQLALTYQKNEDTRKSQEQFEKAITLWREIGAPKQIERVEKAMSSK